MRKLLWPMLAILVIAVCAPYASADSSSFGTYTAECLGPCASDPLVSLTTTSLRFTVFGNAVPYTGLSLDEAHLYGWDIDNGALIFTDLTTDTPVVPPVTLIFPASNERGLFVAATIPAPEPSSLGFALIGLCGLVLCRRVLA